MSEPVLRTIATAAIALLLFVQSRRGHVGARRRRAFELGAAAFSLFAVGNILAWLGVGGQLAIGISSLLGLLLLVSSLVFLFMAYRAGEMSTQLRQAREMIAEERAKFEDKP